MRTVQDTVEVMRMADQTMRILRGYPFASQPLKVITPMPCSCEECATYRDMRAAHAAMAVVSEEEAAPLREKFGSSFQYYFRLTDEEEPQDPLLW